MFNRQFAINNFSLVLLVKSIFVEKYCWNSLVNLWGNLSIMNKRDTMRLSQTLLSLCVLIPLQIAVKTIYGILTVVERIYSQKLQYISIDISIRVYGEE